MYGAVGACPRCGLCLSQTRSTRANPVDACPQFPPITQSAPRSTPVPEPVGNRLVGWGGGPRCNSRLSPIRSPIGSQVTQSDSMLRARRGGAAISGAAPECHAKLARRSLRDRRFLCDPVGGIDRIRERFRWCSLCSNHRLPSVIPAGSIVGIDRHGTFCACPQTRSNAIRSSLIRFHACPRSCSL
ncbi:hypothetical protein CA51_41190 [Rosistilla oblonga]|nr:hypothetical protein CA51_41190 [Rosistilla oblonga]